MSEPDCSQQAYAEDRHDYDLRKLEADNERLRGLLEFCVQSLECGAVHHDKHEYHRASEPCPVMDRLRAALSATDQPQACCDFYAITGQHAFGCKGAADKSVAAP